MPGNIDYIPNSHLIAILSKGNFTFDWVINIQKEAKTAEEARALQEFALVSSVSHGKQDLANSLLELNHYFEHINASFQTLQFNTLKKFKTLLGFAAYHGQLDMVKWLVKKGTNIHGLSVSGQTPLHEAVFGGLDKKLVIQDPNDPTLFIREVFVPIGFLRDGITTRKFIIPIGNQHVNVFDFLLDCGVKEIDKFEGKTTLEYANTSAVFTSSRIINYGGQIPQPTNPPPRQWPTWVDRNISQNFQKSWAFPEIKGYLERRKTFLEETKPTVQTEINTLLFSSCSNYIPEISTLIVDYLKVDDIVSPKPIIPKQKPKASKQDNCSLQ